MRTNENKWEIYGWKEKKKGAGLEVESLARNKDQNPNLQVKVFRGEVMNSRCAG